MKFDDSYFKEENGMNRNYHIQVIKQKEEQSIKENIALVLKLDDSYFKEKDGMKRNYCWNDKVAGELAIVTAVVLVYVWSSESSTIW